MFPTFNEIMYCQRPRRIIESKLEEIEKRCLREEETYTKLKIIILEIKEEIARKKRKEELVARSEPEEFIAQSETMLREKDEETYEEEAVMVSEVSSKKEKEIDTGTTIK